MDTQFRHLDTTSFSLTGQYYGDSDENEIFLTHGYSKDHRPDLKQAVLELLVSRDGGVPLVSQIWDGNTSDNEVFKKRSQALVKSLAVSDGPVYVVADILPPVWIATKFRPYRSGHDDSGLKILSTTFHGKKYLIASRNGSP